MAFDEKMEAPVVWLNLLAPGSNRNIGGFRISEKFGKTKDVLVLAAQQVAKTLEPGQAKVIKSMGAFDLQVRVEGGKTHPSTDLKAEVDAFLS